MDDLTREKTALRKAMRARRALLKTESLQAAVRAAERLPLSKLPAFAVFSGYMPQGSEFDPWPVIERLESTGAILALLGRRRPRSGVPGI